MNWKITLKKALLGFLTFVVAYTTTNPQILLGLLPENIVNMTVGGFITAILVAISNYLKNKSK